MTELAQSLQKELAEAKAEVARLKESYLAGQSLAAAQLATLREEAFLRQFNITKTAEAELTALRARAGTGAGEGEALPAMQRTVDYPERL